MVQKWFRCSSGLVFVVQKWFRCSSGLVFVVQKCSPRPGTVFDPFLTISKANETRAFFALPCHPCKPWIIQELDTRIPDFGGLPQARYPCSPQAFLYLLARHLLFERWQLLPRSLHVLLTSLGGGTRVNLPACILVDMTMFSFTTPNCDCHRMPSQTPTA